MEIKLELISVLGLIMTDYMGVGSRILFTLRAVAQFLLHRSTCNVTTGLVFNSRLAIPIQK
jgi:hypothetical protein